MLSPDLNTNLPAHADARKKKTTETIPCNSVNSLSVTLATADAKTSLTGLSEHEALDQASAMTWQIGLVQQMRRNRCTGWWRHLLNLESRKLLHFRYHYCRRVDSLVRVNLWAGWTSNSTVSLCRGEKLIRIRSIWGLSLNIVYRVWFCYIMWLRHVVFNMWMLLIWCLYHGVWTTLSLRVCLCHFTSEHGPTGFWQWSTSKFVKLLFSRWWSKFPTSNNCVCPAKSTSNR